MNIRKVKLCSGGCVEVKYLDSDSNEITFKGTYEAHPDLHNAFGDLKPYLADVTEQKEASSIDWDTLNCEENEELLRRLTVTAVGVSGGHHKTVTLTGERTLLTGKTLALNAAGISMDYEDSGWEHLESFDLAIDRVIYEAELYVTEEKKRFEEPSLFEGNPDDPFAETTPTEDVTPIEEE